MTRRLLVPALLQCAVILPVLSVPVLAGEGEKDGRSTAFAEEVEAYRRHVDILANEVMGGRLPGTAGMEMAMAYMEHHLQQVGLAAPFEQVVRDAQGAEVMRLASSSYRQPFELAASASLLEQALEVVGGPTFVGGEDFQMLSFGDTGDLTAGVVFVGYSIERGRAGEDYSGFAEGDDLTGKIALMLRFEPMDAEGKSLWGGSPWTARAGFDSKVREAVERGAAGIIIAQTPGAADDRVNELVSFRSGRRRLDGPVAMVSLEAGDELLEALGSPLSLAELRDQANEGRVFRELDGRVRMLAKVERTPVIAENVAGLLPGKGSLASELIVIGAHLDHLGNGDFGSRAKPEERGLLHPGADDNASGSAALILLAERLKRDYDALPEGAEARGILFIGFSAEESGLHGAGHYVEEPIVPLEAHQLMINFDMIGRIVNSRLSVSGADSGKGLQEFLAPFLERTSLEVVQPEGMSGGSDHLSFLQKGVPALFGIIADFHDDYHTPRDTRDKINCEDAVNTVELFHQVALAAATRPERFEFQEQERRSRRDAQAGGDREQAPRMTLNVRFGIQPSSYADSEAGVGVNAVTPKSSADEAGVLAGDRLIGWNGSEIADVRAWMEMLVAHEPGDEVEVTVLRDGEKKVLKATLQGKDEGGR